jgi:ParB-like chromosome segregation protein Spo0J
VDLELHQLTLRFERLRKRRPREERALLVSLSDIGQQLPVVVIQEAPSFILIDGYKRVRALKRLARDTVRATCWQVAEAEALLLERGLRRGSEDALDQAWLLAELQERCQWSLEELARRFEHSKSWVSGRLALLQALPTSIQEQIRAGSISAHAAMKYLVPLARVNAAAAQALATAMTPLKPTSRQVGALYAGWQDRAHARADHPKPADLPASASDAGTCAAIGDPALFAGSRCLGRHRTPCPPSPRGPPARATARE